MKLKDACSSEGKLWQTSFQFSLSVVYNSLNPMDYTMPGFPVHHQLPEFTQTDVYCVGDAIQPSHSLSSPAFNLSQHPGLFKMSQLFASGGQSIGISASVSVLPMNTQDWSPLGLGLVITFPPRSKCLLISWLQSPSRVILEPRKTKLATVSTISPSIFHEVMGWMPWS